MEERYYDEYRRIQDEHWWFVGRRKVLAAVKIALFAGLVVVRGFDRLAEPVAAV